MHLGFECVMALQWSCAAYYILIAIYEEASQPVGAPLHRGLHVLKCWATSCSQQQLGCPASDAAAGLMYTLSLILHLSCL